MTPNRYSNSQLEYLNRYGAIFDDSVVFIQENMLKVSFDSISKVRLSKRRKIVRNITVVLGAIFFVVLVATKLFPVETQFKIALYAFSGVLFLYGIFLKKYVYKLIIEQKSLEVINVEVKIDYKEDAKSIFSKIQRRIKKTEQFNP